MKQIYKIEIKRAFINRRMLLALSLGIAIGIVQIVQWSGAACSNLKMPDYESIQTFYPSGVYDYWICSNGYGWEQYAFFLVLPLIAAIPYGTSLFEDWKGGYAKNFVIRSGKRHYMRAKFLALFLSGGTAVVLPLVLNFMFYMIFLPLNNPQVTTFYHGVGSDNALASLFYSVPALYMVVFMMIDFVYGGVMAGICLVMSDMTDNRYIVEIAPMFVHVFIYALSMLAGVEKCDPVHFLNMDSDGISYMFIVLFVVSVALCVTAYLEYLGRKGEV